MGLTVAAPQLDGGGLNGIGGSDGGGFEMTVEVDVELAVVTVVDTIGGLVVEVAVGAKVVEVDVVVGPSVVVPSIWAVPSVDPGFPSCAGDESPHDAARATVIRNGAASWRRRIVARVTIASSPSGRS